ncbi:MAG: flagellar biosynthetic protein FliO, partial [Halanaerobium sp.]
GETIYLVKVFDEIVMLGGSKEELNYLRSWPIAEIDLDFKDLKKAKNNQANFKSKLKNILAKGNNSNSSDHDV